MIGLLIGFVVFSLAGYFFVKQVNSSSKAGCQSCTSDCQCDGNCGCS